MVLHKRVRCRGRICSDAPSAAPTAVKTTDDGEVR
jgi:hypothetical protein